MDTPKLPIGVAAKMSGVSADSIRAWERRYGAISPERHSGGRLFSQEDIHRLKLLKRLVDQGHRISQLAPMETASLEGLVTDRIPIVAQDTDPWPMRDPLEQVWHHLEAFDAAAADRVLGKWAGLMTTRSYIHRVVLPLLKRIGHSWQEGKISITQEHLISGILRSILGTLLRLNDAYLPERWLFTTPSGELHEFGVLVAAMLTVSVGKGTVYLGPNLPPDEIAGAARQTRAKKVVLGLTPEKRPTVQVLDQIRQLRKSLPNGCRVVIGGGSYGHGFVEEARALDITYLRNFNEYENYLVGSQHQ